MHRIYVRIQIKCSIKVWFGYINSCKYRYLNKQCIVKWTNILQNNVVTSLICCYKWRLCYFLQYKISLDKNNNNHKHRWKAHENAEMDLKFVIFIRIWSITNTRQVLQIENQILDIRYAFAWLFNMMYIPAVQYLLNIFI